jgi:hypothetical protein
LLESVADKVLENVRIESQPQRLTKRLCLLSTDFVSAIVHSDSTLTPAALQRTLELKLTKFPTVNIVASKAFHLADPDNCAMARLNSSTRGDNSAKRLGIDK